MECNKEEAIRAKGIAENKMQNRDFVGARKVVLKAQQLFPDLENVPQMLTVCEVHCSAAVKVNGETDWYGILQVEPTADDSTIKKQYRKLAFLLHPDKNKFEGAEAAFKLVGEAHRLLSDQTKRGLHDMKRGAGFRTVSLKQPTQQSNRPSCTKKQPGVVSNTANVTSKFNGLNQQPPPPFSSAQTFWTMCPSCGVRYQYYQNIMNRPLRCQSCMKPFVAYDLNAQAVPSAANPVYSWNNTGSHQQENPGSGANHAGQKSYFGNASGMGFQGKVDGGSTATEPCSKSEFSSEFGGGSKNKAKEDGKMDRDVGTANEVKFEKVKLQEVNKREQTSKASAGKVNKNRRRKIVEESSETLSSDSDVIIEDGHHAGQDVGSTSRFPRRSSRQKQNVSYNENGSDDDDFVSPQFKRLRKGGTMSNADRSCKEFSEGDEDGVELKGGGTTVSTDMQDDKRKGYEPCANLGNGLNKREQQASNMEEGLNTGACSKAHASIDLSSDSSPDGDSISYPDPEFADFEKERDERKFEADQIWAVYDEADGMPRYYARIRHVYGPEFNLKFSWLEYDPVAEAEIEWLKKDLPVGVGNFKLGKSETSQDRRMFSHLMPWRKGKKKNSYEIYPRKGEVWALFKDWNIRWSSDADNHKTYEYEVVEVLSDFVAGGEISVVQLVKIQGFVSLFVRAVEKGAAPLKILANEALRFSHKIPSYRMTGEEREGIPQGSLELDSFALPINFSEMFPSVNLESTKAKVEISDAVCNGLHFQSADTGKLPTCTTHDNGFDLNERSVLDEKHRRKEPLSYSGSSACEEHIHSSTTQHAAEESGKNVGSEAWMPKQQVIADEGKNSVSQSSPSSLTYEYPESEFHNFDEWRSKDKFEQGQIWALYSDVDMYPKYYGRIDKVDLEDFQVHVTWLDACSVLEEEVKWGEELPFGCGTFKIIKDAMTYSSTETFSHLVQAKPCGKKDRYVIYPSIGEIWAVFKNWNSQWSRQDLTNCEFDVVEVIASNSSGFKVAVLTKVNGYRTVFMNERKGGAVPTMDIPFCERLKFSHRIPAFRLTEEKGGKLRGYWELDPASVPDVLLFTNSD